MKKGTIDATPQRWAALKAENKEYAKFEHRGLENAAELERMFDKIVTTGETAWTPAAGAVFPDQDVGQLRVEDAVDLEERSGDSDDVNIMATPTQRSNEKRKNKVGSSSNFKGKKVKSGGAAYMQKQLDRLCDAVESYTEANLTESSRKNYADAPTDSVGECMDLLLTLPGIEDGDELFMLGTRLFVKQEYRNMFRSIKSVNSKIAWLKQELETDKVRAELNRQKASKKH
ncbi:hypothetical protein SLE2022_336660 [Rubroshorea leprosula]